AHPGHHQLHGRHVHRPGLLEMGPHHRLRLHRPLPGRRPRAAARRPVLRGRPGALARWRPAMAAHGALDERGQLAAAQLRQGAGTVAAQQPHARGARQRRRAVLPVAGRAGLWRAGITTDFAPPGAELSRYQVVFVPALYLVSDADAARLVSYVDSGGTLLVGPYSGVVDEQDRVRYPSAFMDLAGVRIEE